jgi:hypothetical protein
MAARAAGQDAQPMSTAMAPSPGDRVPEGAAPALSPRRRQRYVLLLLCVLCLLALQGVAAPGDLQRVAVTALSGASLLLALRAADVTAPILVPAAVLAIAGLILSVVQAVAGGVGEGTTLLMNAALVGLGPPAIALGVTRDLRASRMVRVESLAGVLSLYMLLGMLFAFLYGAVDRLGSDSLFAGGEPATVANCVYFSFTTLTTVGYGDLAAAIDLGRTMAIFEALLGQIYLVTVVSLIVSNLGRTAGARRS